MNLEDYVAMVMEIYKKAQEENNAEEAIKVLHILGEVLNDAINKLKEQG